MPVKTTPKTIKTTPKIVRTIPRTNINNILIENFVSLQKVLVDMTSKIDELTTKISRMLELFETSAEELSKGHIEMETTGKDSKITEKIEGLSEQNKIIARGITLIHDRMSPPTQPQQRPMMRQPAPAQQKPREEYRTSISSR